MDSGTRSTLAVPTDSPWVDRAFVLLLAVVSLLWGIALGSLGRWILG